MKRIYQMSILFYLRHSRISRNGKAPVYYRITINGERSTGCYTGQKVLPNEWKNNRATGNVAANLVFDTIEQKLNLIYATQLAAGNTPTVATVLAAFEGKAHIGLEQLAILFFEYCEKTAANMRLDKEERMCSTTVNTYRYKFKHIQRYYETQKIPIPAAHLFTANTLQNVTDWLRQESPIPLQRSTIARVVTVMKKITQFGYKKGYLADDCLKNYVYVRGADKEPVFLTLAQVEKIWTYPYDNDLQPIADLFVLQCYTGMYIADVHRITPNVLDIINNRPYLIYYRAKNGQKATVPLFEPALLVLNKYNFDLPFVKADYYNQQLKRVGDKAGIPINLTNKMGRKTFAHLCKNHWGYSTTAIAAMLGHIKEETQRHYSRPTGQSVIQEHEKKAISFL